MLEKYNLGSAAHVILAGQSAGGLGIISLLDKVSMQIKSSGSKALIVGAPEGGFYFLNDRTYHGPHPQPKKFIPWGTNHFPIYFKLWHDQQVSTAVSARPKFVDLFCQFEPVDCD